MSEVKDTIRDTFVARFGESDALRIEAAASEHLDSTHADDRKGSSSFRYDFLLAVGFDCVTLYRQYHDIVAASEDMRAWALEDGHLGEHDGDVPDYLSLMSGALTAWVSK